MTDNNKELNRVMFSYTANRDEFEEENRILKDTVGQLKTELDRYKQPALMVCEVTDIMGERAIIRVPNGNQFYVNIASEVKNLAPGELVLCEQKNLTVVKIVDISRKFDVEKFVIIEKPKVTWEDIGGLEKQRLEIQEVVELPLKKPELFKKVGIQPPKGILLYGPPGTGKTLLAKAVAHSTKSTFIEVVGSELVQKFIGEGAKLVKEIFELAKKKAPSIIFIDELDAIAATRVDIGTSGEREVQRTFMQLLSEIDGFKHLGNVKIIGCTNRRDILDPAVTRPGRLDRLIHVDLPNADGLREIFKIHTREMTFDKKVDPDRLLKLMDGFSGAEVKAVCTEAGYFAIRENRIIVTQKDLMDAVEKVRFAQEQEGKDYMNMFG